MAANNAKCSKELSVEQLRLLGEAIDSSPSPLTLYDPDFRLIYANETSRTVWPELHEAFAAGEGLEKACFAASRAMFPGAPEATIVKAAHYVMNQFSTSDPHDMMAGPGRWMKVTHHRIHDRAVAGVGVDISDLKRREKQLKVAKEAQENLIDVLEYGLLVIDDDGVITLFNTSYQNYCRSNGFEARKGMHVKELTHNFVVSQNHDIGEQSFDDWFDAFYASRFNSETLTEEFSLKDGRHIRRHQQYRKHVGNIVTIADITEIKRAQLKAESAERSKSEFLANMSHEIRTPMNGILGMAYLLSRRSLDLHERQLVEIIQRSGSALVTIINDILDFSKIEAGQVVLENAPFNLRDCIQDVIALLSLAAAEKDVDLQFHMEPGLPETFIGDAGRLRQIITNIFGNAVKFTEQGYVRVSVSGQPNDKKYELVIVVEDTGIGIPGEKLRDIFEKFQQADGSNTRKYEGTGLGLSIAKRLSKLMGGDIVVESEENKGSRFEIRISLPESKVADSMLKFDDAKVLIVSNNVESVRKIDKGLTELKARTVPVISMQQAKMAFEVARENNIRFDCILLDMPMSERDKHTLVDSLKTQENYQDIPVLLFKTPTNIGTVKRWSALGLNANITKLFQDKDPNHAPEQNSTVKQTIVKRG